MNYHTLGEYQGDPRPDKCEMAVRDLLSATETLLDMTGDQLKLEIDDIELAHARLSKIIQRITHGADSL